MSPVDFAPCRVDAELRTAEVSIEDIGCALASLYGARALFDATARSAVLALGSQLFAARNIQLHNGWFCSCNSQLGWQGHLKRRRRDSIVRRDRSDTNDTKSMTGDIVAIPKGPMVALSDYL